MAYKSKKLKPAYGFEARLAPSGVGVLKVPTRRIASPEQVQSVLEQLAKAGVSKIALDLSDAPSPERATYLTRVPRVEGVDRVIYVGLREDEIGQTAPNERMARAQRSIGGPYAQSINAAVEWLSRSRYPRDYLYEKPIHGVGLIPAPEREPPYRIRGR